MSDTKPKKPMTAAEFAALPPRSKGYVVYMRGCWDDEPNIPESYDPSEDEREEYERGQMLGVQEAQDED